jgi:hypothetical protein
VQIHYEAVEAVRVPTRDGDHFGDLTYFDFITDGELLLDGREPIGCNLARRGIIRFHGADHCPDVALKRARQFGEARNHDRSIRACPRVANQGLGRQHIDAGSAAFGRQISGRTRRIVRMVDRRLQCSHAELGPIIGRQPLPDEGRENDRRLAKMLDDACFHGEAVRMNIF